MARNLAKEAEQAKQRYQRFNFAVDINLGKKLLIYLADNNIKQADWFKKMIDNTLNDQDIMQEITNAEIQSLQAETVLTQAQTILALVQGQTILTQDIPSFTQVDEKTRKSTKNLPNTSVGGQRTTPLFNPFTIYLTQGIDALQESLAPLDRTQLCDIISGHGLNRHHSKDSLTKDGKPKRYNIFDIKTASTLVQYILDVVPMAALEEKYAQFLI